VKNALLSNLHGDLVPPSLPPPSFTTLDIGVHYFILFLLSAQANLKTPIDHLPAAPGLKPLCMADIVKIPKLFAGGHMSINICRYHTYCIKKVLEAK
jgi:hypothetical protein